jgi:hypothetical protein
MGYMVSIDATWRSAEDDEANIAWARDFWHRLAVAGKVEIEAPLLRVGRCQLSAARGH